jgi:hypothetical protein
MSMVFPGLRRSRNGFVLGCRHPVVVDSMGRMWQMPIGENARTAAAIHRKLRALAAVFLDPAATENEKANAERLKERLEKQLSQESTPEGAWTKIMFQLGRGVKEITSPPSPKGDWTDHAFRLGKMLRRGFKR